MPGERERRETALVLLIALSRGVQVHKKGEAAVNKQFVTRKLLTKSSSVDNRNLTDQGEGEGRTVGENVSATAALNKHTLFTDLGLKAEEQPSDN